MASMMYFEKYLLTTSLKFRFQSLKIGQGCAKKVAFIGKRYKDEKANACKFECAGGLYRLVLDSTFDHATNFHHRCGGIYRQQSG
jgi:hypothetical protein